MSDADCTPGREPRSVAASMVYFLKLWDVMVCVCVYAGIAVDYRATITGYSALFAAAQKSHTAAVDLLLKNGANPNLWVGAAYWSSM